MSSTIRDITDRKRVDDALRQSEANFRAMIEGAYGVYRATPEGKLLVVNDALVKMLGYQSREDVLAFNLATDVFDKDDTRRSCSTSPRRENSSPSWKRAGNARTEN